MRKAQTTTRKEAEKAMTTLVKSSAKLEQLKAQKKLALAAIEEKFAEKISDLTAQCESAETTVRTYAESAPEIFNDQKSCKLAGGTIGYRKGTPKLECLNGFDWDTVKPLLSKDYIRTIEEIDKKTLIANFKDSPEELAKVGLTITQEEAFYVKI